MKDRLVTASLKQSICLDTSRAQVLPGPWRLRGDWNMMHNPHPSTAAPALTFAGNCQLFGDPHRNLPRQSQLGFLAPLVRVEVDRPRCHAPLQLWLTVMPRRAHKWPGGPEHPPGCRWGSQPVLPSQAGSLPAHSHACCSGSTILLPVPARPAELGSALTHAVSAQFPNPFRSERLWVLLNRKGPGLLFWSQTELLFWPLGKLPFFFFFFFACKQR